MRRDPAQPPARSRTGRAWRGFAGDRSGASALEFALVVGPFILLLLAVFEVGAVFFGNFILESATNQGARLIRTGQVQGQKLDAAKFKTEVCKHLSVPIKCSGLKLDVRKFSNFGGSDLTNPFDKNGNLKTSFTFDPGKGGDVVVVRGFYEWPLIAKLPANIGLGNMTTGNRLLIATAAFRNEPFK